MDPLSLRSLLLIVFGALCATSALAWGSAWFCQARAGAAGRGERRGSGDGAGAPGAVRGLPLRSAAPRLTEAERRRLRRRARRARGGGGGAAGGGDDPRWFRRGSEGSDTTAVSVESSVKVYGCGNYTARQQTGETNEPYGSEGGEEEVVEGGEREEWDEISTCDEAGGSDAGEEHISRKQIEIGERAAMSGFFNTAVEMPGEHAEEESAR